MIRFPLRSSPFPTLLFLVSSVGAAVLLGGCGGNAQSTPELEPEVRPVKMGTVAARGTGTAREYPGTVAAPERATLSFEAPGTVSALPVGEGETVRDGQLVARLDTQDVRARLDAALATRNAAESAYARAQRLYEQGIVPQQELEARRRAFKQARSDVELAREAMGDTRLQAPAAGEVTQTHVEQNETVGAAQPIVSIRSTGRMEVEVAVPEQDQLRRSLRSAPLQVALPLLPERRFPAELTEIETVADPSSRTFEATLAFEPPPEVDVLPGMTARAIVGDEAAADTTAPLTVPVGAVFSGEGGDPAVWVVDPETREVSARAVETGVLRGERVTVHGDVQAGDRIAVTGVQQLHDGQAVRPLDEE